jgi:hypothetical protein
MEFLLVNFASTHTHTHTHYMIMYSVIVSMQLLLAFNEKTCPTFYVEILQILLLDENTLKVNEFHIMCVVAI